MRKVRVGLELVVVLALAAALAAAVKFLLEKKPIADATADEIEARLRDLDPITRAAVMARLSKDAGQELRDLRG